MRQRFFAPSLEIAGNKSDTCELSLRNGANRGEKMTHKKQDLIDQKLQDLNNDGIDRRGFLKCMGMGGYRTGLDHERWPSSVSGIRQGHGSKWR
jgi:hypothetical protein